jgi:hypothetical protein
MPKLELSDEEIAQLVSSCLQSDNGLCCKF